jgi:hypothetical protein
MLPEDLWIWSRYAIGAGIIASILFGATTAAAPGFYVSGELSATDTEREEGMVAIGNDVILIVRDQPIYDRQIAPLIGSRVRLVLVAK